MVICWHTTAAETGSSSTATPQQQQHYIETHSAAAAAAAPCMHINWLVDCSLTSIIILHISILTGSQFMAQKESENGTPKKAKTPFRDTNHLR